jgi:hypothetical protein
MDRDSVVSHSLGLILVDLLEMQHPNFLEGGWVWVLCFLSAVGILKRAQMIMSHGLLGKRFVIHACNLIPLTYFLLVI